MSASTLTSIICFFLSIIFFAWTVPIIGLPVASIKISIFLSSAWSKELTKFIFEIVSLVKPLFKQFFFAWSSLISIIVSMTIFSSWLYWAKNIETNFPQPMKATLIGSDLVCNFECRYIF